MIHEPTILLVEPNHYNVSYSINPWMDPAGWSRDPHSMTSQARTSFDALRDALRRAGFRTVVVSGTAGQPDMVFPANAAIVLDGRALLARFRFPERQGEEAPFAGIFDKLRSDGLIDDVALLPEGCFQEGAGDCIWDASRGHFWAGFGPRSTRAAIDRVTRHFGKEVVALELATEQSYHLDVGFCPLSGGEILYYPPALTTEALRTLRARVPASLRIEASADDLRHFSVNAVNHNDQIVMARTTTSLRETLARRGYHLQEIDMAPFMLSGGGVYCMTLRLDRTSGIAAVGARTGHRSETAIAA